MLIRMRSRRFSDLSPGHRAFIVMAGVVQIGLLIAAQLDIARRPGEQVRGSKTVWRLLTFINFLGPISYFRWGRRRT